MLEQGAQHAQEHPGQDQRHSEGAVEEVESGAEGGEAGGVSHSANGDAPPLKRFVVRGHSALDLVTSKYMEAIFCFLRLAYGLLSILVFTVHIEHTLPRPDDLC